MQNNVKKFSCNYRDKNLYLYASKAYFEFKDINTQILKILFL